MKAVGNYQIGDQGRRNGPMGGRSARRSLLVLFALISMVPFWVAQESKSQASSANQPALSQADHHETEYVSDVELDATNGKQDKGARVRCEARNDKECSEKDGQVNSVGDHGGTSQTAKFRLVNGN
jgi:hypothetical protein